MMLHELLTEKTIQIQSQADNWEEAIVAASRPLVEQDCITGGYVAAMIHNVKKLGPYIVIVPHIAIAHARPDQGVHQLSMSMLCLEHPVSFSEKEEHQVRLVIVLAAVDHESHLHALSQLASLLSEADKIEKIMSASSVKEVMPILQSVADS